MNTFTNLCRAAAMAGVCFAAPAAWAAAPSAGIETEMPMPEAVSAAPATIYELDTEMVVHDWVLCISQSVAEQLVHAREESIAAGLSAYESLTHERKCGQFAELRVILQESLYASKAESGFDARVFGALVNFSDNWASAFVVSDGLLEE